MLSRSKDGKKLSCDAENTKCIPYIVQCYTTNMVNSHGGNFPESVIFKRFGLFIALLYPMLTSDCLRNDRLVLISCDFFYGYSRIQGYCNLFHNHP